MKDMKMRTAAILLTFALIAAVPALGDEIVLKDGKRLPWKSITDNGDSYDVDSGFGPRLTISKADVEKIEVSKAPAALPLTGATFTFDAKKTKLVTADLLARLDTGKCGFTGQWKATAGTLVGVAPSHTNPAGTDRAKISLDFSPSQEYDVTFIVEKREDRGEAGIEFGLIGAGKQFMFSMDAWGVWSGVFLYDGKGANETGLGLQSKVFENGKPRTLTFMVRKEAFIVKLDGKDFWSWKPEWSKLTLSPYHVIPQKNVIFLSAYKGTFAISQAKAVFPKE